MRLVLHPKVYSDIDQIMAYYEQIATMDLADDSYAELRHFMMAGRCPTQLFCNSQARYPTGEPKSIPLSFSFQSC